MQGLGLAKLRFTAGFALVELYARVFSAPPVVRAWEALACAASGHAGTLLRAAAGRWGSDVNSASAGHSGNKCLLLVASCKVWTQITVLVHLHIPARFPGASMAVSADLAQGGFALPNAALESKKEAASALGPAGLVDEGGKAGGPITRSHPGRTVDILQGALICVVPLVFHSQEDPEGSCQRVDFAFREFHVK